jgi:PRTRC genetic system protein C
MYEDNSCLARFHRRDITQSRFHKHFGETKDDHHHSEDQQLAPGICLQRVTIPDPGPQMSIEQVCDPLIPSYPEITTATMTGPEDTGTSLRYSFSRAIGSKG